MTSSLGLSWLFSTECGLITSNTCCDPMRCSHLNPCFLHQRYAFLSIHTPAAFETLCPHKSGYSDYSYLLHCSGHRPEMPAAIPMLLHSPCTRTAGAAPGFQLVSTCTYTASSFFCIHTHCSCIFLPTCTEASLSYLKLSPPTPFHTLFPLIPILFSLISKYPPSVNQSLMR